VHTTTLKLVEMNELKVKELMILGSNPYKVININLATNYKYLSYKKMRKFFAFKSREISSLYNYV